MAGTSEGGKRIAQKLTKDNPNYYSELSKKRKNPFGGKRYSYEKGHPHAAKGGRVQKRTSGKIIREKDLVDPNTLEGYELKLEEL